MPDINHLHCVYCGSSDAFTIFEEGNGHCHSCEESPNTKQVALAYPEYVDGGPIMETKPEKKKLAFITGTCRDIPPRSISKKTCEAFNYQTARLTFDYQVGEWVANPSGDWYQVANYYNQKNELVGQKLRDADKKFTILGKLPTLFGKQLWEHNPRQTLVITEGEIDALSIYEAFGGTVAAVSITNGAQSAKKAIKEEIEWIDQNFSKIIVMMDNDKNGAEASDSIVDLLNPAKLALPHMGDFKDANEVLTKKGTAELRRIINEAKAYTPDGVITGWEADSLIDEMPEVGLSYPFPLLTEATGGIRLNEFNVITAGTGTGKTSFVKEIIVHLRKEHDKKVGVIFLEEPTKTTMRSLYSKAVGENLMTSWFVEPTEEQRELLSSGREILVADNTVVDKARSIILGEDHEDEKLLLYKHFGFKDYEKVKNVVSYMLAKGCQYIFIDNLTALTSGDRINDERKLIDFICGDLSSITASDTLPCHITLVSHLKKVSGTPHEEGGKISTADLRGSASVGMYAHCVIGLERDQQDLETRNKVRLRIMKDRYGGNTAQLIQYAYNAQTTQLTEEGYVGEDGEFFDQDFEDVEEAPF